MQGNNRSANPLRLLYAMRTNSASEDLVEDEHADFAEAATLDN